MKQLKFFALGLIILTGCNGLVSKTPPPVELPKVTQTIVPAQQPTTTPSSPPIAESEDLVIDQNNAGKLAEITSSTFENIGRMYWMPDGTSLAIVSLNKLLILKSQTLEISQEIALQENETLLDFDPIHGWLAITTDRNTLSIIDLNKNKVSSFSQPGGFGSAAFDSTGKYIWLSSMETFEGKAYNTSTGETGSVCNGFETAAPVYAVYPSPHGEWLVWQARATIQLNKISDCTPGARLGHEDFVISLAFNSNENTLVTSTGGTYQGEFQPLVFFWDAQTGDQTGIIPLNEYPATSMVFSPNDELLATAGDGLTLWDAEDKTEIKALIPSGTRMTAVSFSSDGKMLVASDETTLHVFTLQP